jgi:hypothetical protein
MERNKNIRVQPVPSQEKTCQSARRVVSNGTTSLSHTKNLHLIVDSIDKRMILDSQNGNTIQMRVSYVK